MESGIEKLEILKGTHVWRGTPWDYSSLITLNFKENSVGESTLGYGQTIYVICHFHYYIEKDALHFRYKKLETSQHLNPRDIAREKNIKFKLSSANEVITENIVSYTYQFSYRIEFSCSPFPEEISFPYPIPLVFYGYPDLINT